MIPFSGMPLDRADALRGDSARLTELRAGGLRLRMDGLLPATEGDALVFEPLDGADEDLVFLGLQGERGVFAAVPAE